MTLYQRNDIKWTEYKTQTSGHYHDTCYTHVHNWGQES